MWGFSRGALQISITIANRWAGVSTAADQRRYLFPSVFFSLSLSSVLRSPSTLWMLLPSFLPPPSLSDSDNSLLRYLSDDKILVIEEEPEGLGRESRRDSTRRSRRKSRNPSSPSFPISPSMLSSTLRLDQPPDALPVRKQSINIWFWPFQRPLIMLFFVFISSLIFGRFIIWYIMLIVTVV